MRGPDGRFRRQPADDLHEAHLLPAPLDRLVEHQRLEDVDLRGSRKEEIVGQHAGDRPDLVIEPQGLAREAGSGAEQAVPEPLAHQHGVAPLELLLDRQERPALRRPHAEDRQEVGGDESPLDALRSVVLPQGEAFRAGVRRDARQEPALVPPVQEVAAGGQLEIRAHDARRHMDQPLGVAEGERPQQHGMDHAEQGGIGADAEGERDDRHRGEGRPSHQGAGGNAKVESERVHRRRLLSPGCNERLGRRFPHLTY